MKNLSLLLRWLSLAASLVLSLVLCSAAFAQPKPNRAVRAEEEDKSADFSQEPPQIQAQQAAAPAGLDVPAWEAKLRRYSAVFRKHPDVYRSLVSLEFEDGTRYFVSSEGSKVV